GNDGRWVDLTHLAKCLIVENHRSKDCFRHQIVTDLRLAFELPNIAAISLLCDVDIKPIARKNWPSKASAVDAHEINELALRFGPKCMNDKHRRRLRHCFDDQYARHDRARREMSLKITFVDGHVFDTGRP